MKNSEIIRIMEVSLVLVVFVVALFLCGESFGLRLGYRYANDVAERDLISFAVHGPNVIDVLSGTYALIAGSAALYAIIEFVKAKSLVVTVRLVLVSVVIWRLWDLIGFKSRVLKVDVPYREWLIATMAYDRVLLFLAILLVFFSVRRIVFPSTTQ